MFSFSYKITCLKCNHTFMYADRETEVVHDDWLDIDYPESKCPNCHQWLSNTQTYHDDGSIAAITSGGSATAFLRKGYKFPQ